MSSHLAGERSRRITLIKLISGKKKKEREKGKSKEGGMLIKKNKRKIIQCIKLIPQPVKKKGLKYTLHTLQTAETLYKGLLTKIHFTSFKYTV